MGKVIHVYQQPRESVEQVLRRAKTELVRAFAPDKPEAFVMKFRLSGHSPQLRMSAYEGAVVHPCAIRHRHTRKCGKTCLGYGLVFVYWLERPISRKLPRR
jgi:hypothetical protein